MRVLKVPETGPKRKLLDAAERLVLEKGFDAVSVRDITGAVKANVAAVNYHFGSREGLLDLVMFHALGPLCEERKRSLEQAERQRAGKMVSLEDTLHSYIYSIQSVASRSKADYLDYLLLAGKTLVLPEASISPMISMLKKDVSEKYLAALVRVSPSAERHELATSWRFFEAGLNQSLQSISPKENLEQVFADWVSFGVRGFSNRKPEILSKEGAQGQLFDF